MRINIWHIIINGCFLLSLCSSCTSNKILTDRTQFVKDGNIFPGVDLHRYQSVQTRPGQDSSMALAVAISGGGSRAANFAIGVMLGLEEIATSSGRNVLQEVDYLSTVSGGGFAGGAYIAALYEYQKYGESIPFSFRNYVDDHIKADLKHSYTKTLIGALFNPKIWFTYHDDGDALERVIDDLVLGYKRRRSLSEAGEKARSLSLRDLFVDRDSLHIPVRLPMMVANASLLDKMGIFPFTPDILEQYHITGYSHRLKKYWYDEGAFDIYEMPLSVGIKASGSFPALISNTTLCSCYHPRRKYLHIIDGAMTDNFGFRTAVDLLRQDEKVEKKMLLVIDADNAGNLPTFARKQNARLSFKVYGRLASSGLDARRINLLKDLQEAGESLDFYPLVVGFSALIHDNDELPPAVIYKKQEQKRLIHLLKTEMDTISKKDLQILYELVTNISTKYTITANEQDLLLLTGRKIVKMLENEIRLRYFKSAD